MVVGSTEPLGLTRAACHRNVDAARGFGASRVSFVTSRLSPGILPRVDAAVS